MRPFFRVRVAGVLFVMLLLCVPAIFSQDDVNNVLSKRQEEIVEAARQVSPELYEREKELIGVHKQIQTILQEYKEQSIDQKKAAELLRPLLKRQIEIISNQEYQIERTLVEMLSMPQ